MKNPEKLILKKVYGFKFENSPNIKFDLRMLDYVGKIGIIDEYRPVSKTFKVEFEDGEYWGYPADQIEAHLVEDDESIKEEIKQELSKNKVLICNSDLKIEDEIPTLSDGVMMLVRNDDEKEWFSRKVIGKKGLFYYYWHDDIICKMSQCKPLDPTKEEQLTAILGSDDKVSEIMELFNDKK